MSAGYFKDGRTGMMMHGLAVCYGLGAIVGGLTLASIQLTGIAQWFAFVAATLLSAHGLVIIAYMVHECAHNTVFSDTKYNAKLGALLLAVVGANYARYEDIRYKHFRHHVDNADVVWFDYDQFFRKHPWVYRFVRLCEYLYIPAHDMLMHLLLMVQSFVIAKRKQQRRYNGLVIVVRAIIFALLMAVSWQAAAVYVIAYLLMITVLRFQDSLQHDYDYELTLFSTQKAGQYKGDKAYETEHTFSVPISTRWPILNVLVLNFGYHNAHHARPTLPWYKLPTYHREHFDDDCCIPFKKQLAIFHRYRVARILGEGGELDDQIAVGEQFLKQAKQGKVYGGNAASFLTPF